jgi:hypothetical protein
VSRCDWSRNRLVTSRAVNLNQFSSEQLSGAEAEAETGIQYIQVYQNHVSVSVFRLLSFFFFFEEMKVSICDHHAVCVPPLSTLEWLKLGMYIMATEPISRAYFINPSDQSVCIYIPHTVARQRLGKTLPRQRIHTQQ